MSAESERSDGFSGMQRAVIAVAMAKAFLLYLDRTCMGAVVQSTSFQNEMALGKAEVGSVMSSFFWRTHWVRCLRVGWRTGLGRVGCW